ncbi:MAG: hypothetical protein Q8K93_30005 [Reyranella sp.]|uniref:hypothetical protein n=1 Tax=Reyranella sp. TaxID=1929291 RepID=UPI00272FF948|nr:hypothetical protein [Reyranella sp.]MDP1966425.1 hypothetical protein [Reyranella sp.]MDP2374115.1 hypothetical protein [Reyranella sp.]
MDNISRPTFASIGWVSGKGRRVAVVRCDRQRPASGAGLVRRKVLIDGKEWFCQELDRDSLGGPLLSGERIYLWVTPSS